MDIDAVIYGNNDELIRVVSSLYVNDTDTIADLTYGKGVFWKKVDESIRSRVTGSDLITVPTRSYDFRNTPYQDKEFDIAVLDPPYIHSPGKHITDKNYQNEATTKGHSHNDIRRLYRDGMKEAFRISKKQVWVKCKDQIESGLQRWSHCEILVEALNIGLFARDMFIVIPKSRTSNNRWTTQYHARKPHSYLWIFEHISKKTSAQITREKILDSMNPIS